MLTARVERDGSQWMVVRGDSEVMCYCGGVDVEESGVFADEIATALNLAADRNGTLYALSMLRFTALSVLKRGLNNMTQVGLERACRVAGRALFPGATDPAFPTEGTAQAPQLVAILGEVLTEYHRATSVNDPFHSAHEGFAVLDEERDELWDEVKRKSRDLRQMRHEAIQVTAMGLRFLHDVCPRGDGV